MPCPQIWNIEKEKDGGKEKVGDRPAKLNEKKRDRDLEREIKNKIYRDIFCWKNNIKVFFISGEKMVTGNGNKMSKMGMG